MSQKKYLILPSSYFGPVQFFCRLSGNQPVIIEHYDHYTRQSYRNRCVIMGANRKQSLSIPVKKKHNCKTHTRDIEIDYDTNWQKNHETSIVSAYRSSPFFEYYFDDFRWVFEGRHKFLTDLNLKITRIAISLLGFEQEIETSREYLKESGHIDFRDIIHPKASLSKDPSFTPVEYTQVFSDRHGFMPNLSILDLFFNTGPEAAGILNKSCIL